MRIDSYMMHIAWCNFDHTEIFLPRECCFTFFIVPVVDIKGGKVPPGAIESANSWQSGGPKAKYTIF